MFSGVFPTHPRLRATIHPLGGLLHAFFLVPFVAFITPPLVAEDQWQGTASNPHTTDDIKLMKDCLVEGQRVAFRRDNLVTWVKQGPGSHKRTAPFGVLLSVVPEKEEKGDVAKRVQRDKTIYLVKSGADHADYVSFDQYLMPSGLKNCTPPDNAIANIPVSTIAAVTTGIARNGIQALAYGGGALVAQVVWWMAKHATWLKHPIMIPIVITIVALAGATPTSIANTCIAIFKYAVNTAVSAIATLSSSWLADPWFWFPPVVLLVIWLCIHVNRQPEADHSRPTQCQKPVKKSITPREGNDVPKLDLPEPTRCQAPHIIAAGTAGGPLTPRHCARPPIYVSPLTIGDALFGLDPNVGDTRSIHLCVELWQSYHCVNAKRVCRIPGCQKDGVDFPTSRGDIYECAIHTQRRVLDGGSLEPHPGNNPSAKKLKEEVSSPNMPPLETIPPSDLSDLNHSGPSGTFSTASTQEDLQHRMRDMGGRDVKSSKPAQESTQRTSATNLQTAPCNVASVDPPITCSLDHLRIARTDKANSAATQDRHTTPTKDGTRTHHSHRTRSSSHLSTALASSHFDSRSGGSSLRHRSHHRGKYKRRKRSSTSSSQESCDSLLPQGLAHARYRRPRTVVRHMSIKPKRRGSGDRVDAIVDRLGAMADNEEKKAGGMSKLDQFTVCALRGFGCFEVESCTGIYGQELEGAIRRQTRNDRDFLRRKKLRIPITNRIAKASPTGRFGNVTGNGTDEISVTLADCFALDHQKYRAYRWEWEKIESANKEPHTLACFISLAKQKIILFFLLYGWGHESERKKR